MGRFARANQPDDAVRSLLDELHRLDRHAGEPTVASMAKAIGVSRQTIYNIFRGPTTPSWGYVELLCEFLGGDKERLRTLWIAARESEDHDGPPAVKAGSPRRTEAAGTAAAVDPADGVATPNDAATPDKRGSPRDRVADPDLPGLAFPIAAKHRWRGPDRLRQLERELRQQLARLESLGAVANSPEALSLRHGLCSIQHLRGRFLEVYDGLTELLALECEAYGSRSPQTLTTRHNLAFVLHDLRRPRDAAEELRTILEIEAGLYPPGHEQVADTRVELADALLHAGCLAEALEHYDELLRAGGHHSPEVAAVVAALRERLTNTRFGRVKSWSARGRHGYILADDGRELVFSEDALTPAAAAEADADGRPPPGARVRFEINRNRNGWLEAIEVTPVTD